MTELADVTAAADAYAASRYDQGKADQRTVDQPVIDQLNAQVTALEADEAADEATIAQLRATIASLSARVPGDPGVGRMYVGQSITGADPSKREKVYGCPVGVSRSYFTWGQFDQAVTKAQTDLAAGRLPWISMHNDGSGFGPMASGARDTQIGPLMDRLHALDAPVWWCWDHEPLDNPEWGTAAQFCAMNRHTMGMLPPNVALTPIVQTYPLDPTQTKVGAGSFAPWLEPGSYTFPGIDTYNHRWYVKFGTGQAATKAPGGVFRDPATVLSVVDKLRGDLGLPDLPVGIAETGIRTDPAAPGKAAQWLRDLIAQAPAKGVVAVSYFDSALNSPEGPWSLDSTFDGTDGTERLNAYGPLVAAGAHIKAVQ